MFRKWSFVILISTMYQVLFQLITLFSLLWEVIILCYFGREVQSGSLPGFHIFIKYERFCDSYINIFSLSVQLKIRVQLIENQRTSKCKENTNLLQVYLPFFTLSAFSGTAYGFCIGSRNYFTSNKRVGEPQKYISWVLPLTALHWCGCLP